MLYIIPYIVSSSTCTLLNNVTTKYLKVAKKKKPDFIFTKVLLYVLKWQRCINSNFKTVQKRSVSLNLIYRCSILI